MRKVGRINPTGKLEGWCIRRHQIKLARLTPERLREYGPGLKEATLVMFILYVATLRKHSDGWLNDHVYPSLFMCSCILYTTHGDVIRLVVTSQRPFTIVPPGPPPLHSPHTLSSSSPLPSFRPATPAPRPSNIHIPGGRLSRPGDLALLESLQQLDVSCLPGRRCPSRRNRPRPSHPSTPRTRAAARAHSARMGRGETIDVTLYGILLTWTWSLQVDRRALHFHHSGTPLWALQGAHLDARYGENEGLVPVRIVVIL